MHTSHANTSAVSFTQHTAASIHVVMLHVHTRKLSSHTLTCMHAQTGAHTQRPAASWSVLYMCDAVSGRAADKLHNTTWHSGSSVPWKMSKLASSQHTAPHLMFPPPPTLSLLVLFSQCGLSFRFFITFLFFLLLVLYPFLFFPFLSLSSQIAEQTFFSFHGTWKPPLHYVMNTDISMYDYVKCWN